MLVSKNRPPLARHRFLRWLPVIQSDIKFKQVKRIAVGGSGDLRANQTNIIINPSES